MSSTLGVILAITASILNAIGYTIQKIGHNRVKEYNKYKKKNEIKVFYKDIVWIVGFAVYIVGGLTNVGALCYAPQSLVLPLSSITLVVNTVLATKVLDEAFHRTDFFGIILVFIGTILAILFGPKNSKMLPVNALKLRWLDNGFFIFFISLSSCILLVYIFIKIYTRKHNGARIQSSYILISYCLLAAYWGSLSFLFLKSFTELILTAKMFKPESGYYKNWYAYFTLIGIIISNIGLEKFRQLGLKHFNAFYVVPINQVLLIVMGTILGGIYFQEFQNMAIISGVMFFIAILCTIFGVCVLALSNNNPKTIETDETEMNNITKESIELHTIDVGSIEGTEINLNSQGLSMESTMDSSDILTISSNDISTDVISISYEVVKQDDNDMNKHEDECNEYVE
eukprot:473572_1